MSQTRPPGFNFTLEQIREYLSYDPESGKIRWIKDTGSRFGRVGDVAGAIESNGYCRLSIWGKRFLAHRLAWFLTYERWPKSQIDHINGDRADNRLCNLREATPSQNQANKKLLKNNVSGLRGVRLYKRVNKFCATIVVNRKSIWLGYFDTKEEAAAAHRAAMVEYFGEYARLNEA